MGHHGRVTLNVLHVHGQPCPNLLGLGRFTVCLLPPPHTFDVWKLDSFAGNSEPRMIAASDAAHEMGKGSGGFLFSDTFFCRRRAVVKIDAQVFQLWQAKDFVIAQLELLMVFQALISFPDSFRHNTCVWWIDNIASLMSLVRGRSDSPDLDRLAQMIHMLLFSLHCNMWFEWVQSKSNWTDGISREGFADPFVQEFGFTCHQVAVPHLLWQLPLLPLSVVFSFL